MVTRIPCKHMVPCVHRKRIEFKNVGHAYFSVKIFRKAYLEALVLKVDLDLKKVIIFPSNLKKNVGIPMKNQTKEDDDD